MNIAIDYGNNDQVFDHAGVAYIDLVSGYGSCLLGHSNSVVVAAVQAQLNKVWNCGKQANTLSSPVKSLIESFLPVHYELAQIYSTGMEAIEFSLRVAAVHTGKNSFCAFENSMHGKSIATSSLSWSNSFRLPNFIGIPFIAYKSEAEILHEIEALFLSAKPAAFLVEPIQASARGDVASNEFYSDLIELCNKHGVVSIFDEILVGFYRAGQVSFCFSRNIQPDIVIFGKAIANGFPASAVMCKKSLLIKPTMLPASTYSGNPLACAAILATLNEYKKRDMLSLVGSVEAQIRSMLPALNDIGYTFKGMGILWFITVPEKNEIEIVVDKIQEKKILVSHTKNQIRIMPAATISQKNLIHALESIVEVCKQNSC